MSDEALLLTVPDGDNAIYVDIADPSQIEHEPEGAIVTCVCPIPKPKDAQCIFLKIANQKQVRVIGHGDMRYVTLQLLDDERAIETPLEGNVYIVKYRIVGSHTR